MALFDGVGLLRLLIAERGENLKTRGFEPEIEPE